MVEFFGGIVMKKIQVSSGCEDWQISDEDLDAAYDNTPASKRALIKSTLALVDSVWREDSSHREERIRDQTAGLLFERISDPAPWVILVINSGFLPTHIAAAIMPAYLAGVSRIVAIWIGSEPVPTSLLCTLEISGVDELFVPPSDVDAKSAISLLITLLQENTQAMPLLDHHKMGRILFFGAEIESKWDHKFLVWHENRQKGSFLEMDSTCNDLYLHLDLPPAFFRNSTTKIVSLKEEE